MCEHAFICKEENLARVLVGACGLSVCERKGKREKETLVMSEMVCVCVCSSVSSCERLCVSASMLMFECARVCARMRHREKEEERYERLNLNSGRKMSR